MKYYIVYKYTFPNNKVYIGMSSTTIEKRLKNGYRHCPYIQNAIKKYGKDNIIKELMYEHLTKEEAEQKEIELIAQYKSNRREFGYNIENGGNCANSMAKETKEKISKKLKGRKLSEETKKKISKVNKIRWQRLSEEQKQQEIVRLRTLNIGREPWNKGKKGLQTHTEEWKRKASERMKERNKDLQTKIICVETGEIFENQYEASKFKNTNQGNINSCLKGKRKTAGSCHWQYLL